MTCEVCEEQQRGRRDEPLPCMESKPEKKGTTSIFTSVEQKKVTTFALSVVMNGCMKPETAGRAGNLNCAISHTSDMGIPISTSLESPEAFFGARLATLTRMFDITDR